MKRPHPSTDQRYDPEAVEAKWQERWEAVGPPLAVKAEVTIEENERKSMHPFVVYIPSGGGDAEEPDAS